MNLSRAASRRATSSSRTEKEQTKENGVQLQGCTFCNYSQLKNCENKIRILMMLIVRMETNKK